MQQDRRELVAVDNFNRSVVERKGFQIRLVLSLNTKYVFLFQVRSFLFELIKFLILNHNIKTFNHKLDVKNSYPKTILNIFVNIRGCVQGGKCYIR